MRTPFVIAEFAGSHDGSLDKMLRGVRAAKEADADAFKTWWTSSAERTCARMHAPEMLATYKVGEFPQGWLRELRSACHAERLEFVCTVDLVEDIGVVAPYVDRFKIASWGATDHDMIWAYDQYRKPLVISCGLGATPTVYRHDTSHLLHCVSAYPTPLEECNLSVVRSCDGFSDHTKKVMMGALAVAAGARVLEVHFCLTDTSKDNADRCVSHEPEALKEYIALARKAQIAMGDGVKRVMPSEEPNRRYRYV